MKYRTVIEIRADAENKDEAMEIVGEYLSGNIVSGVEMKCLTRRVIPYKKTMLATVACLLVISAATLSILALRPSQNASIGIPGMDAVQVPLKTAIPGETKAVEFKKEWQARHVKEALDSLKKK